MKRKISNQFLGHFLLMFLFTILATVLTFILISISSSVIADKLSKNRYKASSIVEENYEKIDYTKVVDNGGGVIVINKDYVVVLQAGLDPIGKTSFTIDEFTKFLTESKSTTYHYDILYEPNGEFWLIVIFPTSIRLDFKLVFNKNALSNDLTYAGSAFSLALIAYLIIIALFSFIYSRITAKHITTPLKKLTEGTKLLREGDYSTRVELNVKNEFLDLQNTFNEMAKRIEEETSRRKKAEDDRKRLILDISHDIKSPLASIQGYSELVLSKYDIPEIKVIYQNSIKANKLLNELFEYSKIDSPDFTLKLRKIDLCEELRKIISELIILLDNADFNYEFDIPEIPIYANLDVDMFRRTIQNLTDNAIRYNDKGTSIFISLKVEEKYASIYFKDDGIGIPKELQTEIFKPFVRGDKSRNTSTGGSGLGLSIAKKIAISHGGDLVLTDLEDRGSTFKITIPLI